MNPFFTELGLVITTATLFALLAHLFKQPPLVGYILTGVALGPLGFHLIQDPALFNTFKQIGVALLLFLVGLELDWNKAKHQLRTTFAMGGAQMLASFSFGFAMALLFQQPPLVAFCIGASLAFSSTVIVVKVLSESHDLNSLHGRLSVGLLLFQDFVAAIVLILLQGLNSQNPLLLPVTIALFLSIIWIMATKLLPPLFQRIARSSELLFLSSLAWCFLVAITASYAHFPLEIGAFLAGVSLAPLPYSLDILSRLRSLRDFFVILFFVSLGSQLLLPSLSYLFITLALLVLTLFIKPLITFLALVQRGFKSRTAFMTALTQGQLSEFSLILMDIALRQGLVPQSIASAILFTASGSLLFSTLILTNRERLYSHLRGLLRHFERSHIHSQLPDEQKPPQDHILLFGYHRMGYHILKKLRSLRQDVLVVDSNPDIIKRLKEQKVDCLYGDMQDEDILELVGAPQASMVISTIPHKEETIFLIDALKQLNSAALILVTSHDIDDALEYYQLGADYVILPHLLGGEHVADLITQYEHQSLVHFIRHRAEEIKLLRTKSQALYYD